MSSSSDSALGAKLAVLSGSQRHYLRACVCGRGWIALFSKHVHFDALWLAVYNRIIIECWLVDGICG